MSMQYRGRKGPFRDDMLVLSVAVLMVFVLYIAVDYPSTMANVPANNGNSGGSGQNNGNPTIQLVNEDLLDQSGHTSEGQSSEIAFNAPWSNITWINLTLSWTDDIGNNDQFELKVLSDGQELDSADGSTGAVILSIQLPPSGNYTAVITCVKAPGLVGPSPIDRDSGNDWDIQAMAEREVLQ